MISAKAEQLKEEGNDFFKQQHYLRAIEKFTQAIVISPDYIAALFNLGLCHSKLHNDQLALDYFNQVLAIDGQHTKAIYNLLNLLQRPPETEAKKILLQRHLERYKAKICVLSADIKYTKDANIKLLEITRAYQSGCRGSVYRGIDLTEKLSSLFKKYQWPQLHQVRPLGHPISTMPKQDSKCSELAEAIAKTGLVKDITKIHSYKWCYSAFDLPSIKPSQAVLTIDGLFLSMCCENKQLMHDVVSAAGLQQYRPKTYYLPCFSPAPEHLVAQIYAECAKAQHFVIKAPSMEESKGVLIITRAELDTYVKIFSMAKDQAMKALIELIVDKRKKVGKRNIAKMLDFQSNPEFMMLEEDGGYFLIEEYVSNKPIFRAGKMYDPTIRIFFVLLHDQGHWSYHYLDAYYRLPHNSIAEKVDLRERVIPSYNEDPETVEPIPVADLDAINSQLKLLMLPLMSQMFSDNYFSRLDAMTQPSVKAYHYLHMANTAVGAGNYAVAELALTRATKSGYRPLQYRIHFQRGILLTAQQQYESAIEQFNQTQRLDPSFNAVLHRRALAYYHAGQWDNYKRDIALALANPLNRRQMQNFCLRNNLPIL